MVLENTSSEEDLCLKCVFKILEQLLFFIAYYGWRAWLIKILE